MKTIQTQRQAYEAAAAELERTARAIQRCSRSLERKRREEADRARAEGRAPQPYTGDFARGEGQLDWPVRGDVVGRFGPETHPQVGHRHDQQRHRHRGRRSARRCASVAKGRVDYVSEDFGTYGQMVIVNHGDGYYTLYGHLSDDRGRGRPARCTPGQIDRPLGRHRLAQGPDPPLRGPQGRASRSTPERLARSSCRLMPALRRFSELARPARGRRVPARRGRAAAATPTPTCSTARPGSARAPPRWRSRARCCASARRRRARPPGPACSTPRPRDRGPAPRSTDDACGECAACSKTARAPAPRSQVPVPGLGRGEGARRDDRRDDRGAARGSAVRLHLREGGVDPPLAHARAAARAGLPAVRGRRAAWWWCATPTACARTSTRRCSSRSRSRAPRRSGC